MNGRTVLPSVIAISLCVGGAAFAQRDDLTGLAPLAYAQQWAYTNKDVNLRAGPSRDYPIVAILRAGVSIAVQGCLSDYRWCDVVAGPYRGWIYAGNLVYPYEGATVPVISYGAVLGIGILAFSIAHYWDEHYHSSPWYPQRDHWVNRPPPAAGPGGYRPPPGPAGPPGIGPRPPQGPALGAGQRPYPRPPPVHSPGGAQQPPYVQGSGAGPRPVPGQAPTGGRQPAPGQRPAGVPVQRPDGARPPPQGQSPGAVQRTPPAQQTPQVQTPGGEHRAPQGQGPSGGQRPAQSQAPGGVQQQRPAEGR